MDRSKKYYSLANRQERQAARGLWEEIFPEDSAEFLDYYDQWKYTENHLTTRHSNGKLVSMAQWNPYDVMVKDRIWNSYYVVAVATKPEFRHKGYMTGQIREAMEDFYGDKVPFVFLMPANEKIYQPFDFRFFYDKTTACWTEGEDLGESESEITIRPMELTDYPMVSEFMESHLSARYDLYTRRNVRSIQRIQAECESEGGGLEGLFVRDEFIGCFSWWGGEEDIEIRELLVQEDWLTPVRRGDIWRALVAHFPGKKKITAVNDGWLGEKKPAIMGRILHLPTFLSALGSSENQEIILQVQDRFLPGNNRQFRWILSDHGSIVLELEPEAEVPADITAEIGALLPWLTGYVSAEDCPGITMTPQGAQKAKNITLLRGACFNEIV